MSSVLVVISFFFMYFRVKFVVFSCTHIIIEYHFFLKKKQHYDAKTPHDGYDIPTMLSLYNHYLSFAGKETWGTRSKPFLRHSAIPFLHFSQNLILCIISWKYCQDIKLYAFSKSTLNKTMFSFYVLLHPPIHYL
jgi:hypothetical protein